MLKLLKFFAWLIAGVILMIVVDQFMVRVPMEVAGVKQAQIFYVDFRHRLLSLMGVDLTGSKESIEQLIDVNKETQVRKKIRPQRYLYVDESGVLQFADSLQQVPERYRKKAQPLAE